LVGEAPAGQHAEGSRQTFPAGKRGSDLSAALPIGVTYW
jgi:hypothetical protein